MRTSDIEVDKVFAHAPKSRSLAYSTSTSLVTTLFDQGYISLSKMMDEIIVPRYNRFTNRYETLGRLNQSLYMLSCPIDKD